MSSRTVHLPDDGLNLDHELQQNVHIATVEEKKRLWWRNAFINALFIAGWSAFPLGSISRNVPSELSCLLLGSASLRCCQYTTNGCLTKTTWALGILYSSQHSTCSSSWLWLQYSVSLGHSTSGHRMIHPERIICTLRPRISHAPCARL